MDILGTNYDLQIRRPEAEEADGECDFYERQIRIRRIDDMLETGAAWESKYIRYKEVLRHEIVHAFLHESGMDKYEEDEELVAWIARQYPKIKETFAKYNCEEG